MRVPLHEHFHVSVTSCQRAEVKRVLHCDATTSADMDALLSKKLPAAGIYAFQQIQIYLPSSQKATALAAATFNESTP
mgnify:CR=1 FL=1